MTRIGPFSRNRRRRATPPTFGTTSELPDHYMWTVVPTLGRPSTADGRPCEEPVFGVVVPVELPSGGREHRPQPILRERFVRPQLATVPGGQSHPTRRVEQRQPAAGHAHPGQLAQD